MDSELLEENWGITMDDLDKEADGFAVESQWEYFMSPTAQAFIKLKKLEDQIGQLAEERDEEYGNVEFNEFSHPGSDARWVDVTSATALSLLQNRLNEVGVGIRIEIAPDDMY